ncbi:UDP-N-acetylmuramate dehydrogenase [Paenibacillus sp. ACRRX]|uniref:UDP-N-acetylmuramate dehydrogenase n=1 Tax=unclassified Paenibacillus TaxID=185978 RepID=UPI001EF6D0BB|nr:MULTISPECIES: UDP-N-acetylmuramate dehydrogenase [unclassified Paenibacillus]MCG7410255.1 UDP-N-acetylmuramate dehydrogenase [Paenibacillus sp. ACRRX]MDK8181084.1 UDP-N-acetylmuramate dehydrogenase [Paenibacillus sp. UMB4589-SE434]
MHNLLERYRQLRELISESSVKFDEMLKQHTYTRMGGRADLYVTPAHYEELQLVLSFAQTHQLPLTILGFGSNLIVKDGGIRGIVVNLNHFNAITREADTITAQSGAAIIDVSRSALTHHLSGLEFACGIPGSVGGALYMNAGAYGGEIADVLVSALVLTTEGELLRLTKDELELSYRHSNIGTNGYIVLEATFQLVPAAHDTIKVKMDELTEQRESKQPLEYPSCGSVFKRPPGYFAGKLIQDCALQGVQIGGAQVSTKHAGFIVNVQEATASEYIALIRHVQQTVNERFGVQLETEVRIIGEDE